MTAERQPSPAIRPRDRRSQITSVAAELFWTQGFDGVSIIDLSGAIGITSGALYRHFPSKDDLLAELIRELIHAWYGAALIAFDRSDSAEAALPDLIESAVHVAIDRPSVVGLWYREQRHVPAEANDDIQDMRARTYKIWRSAIRAHRPDLSAEEVEFRLATANGLLFCIPLIDVRVSRDRFAHRLASMMLAQFDAPSSHHLAQADDGDDERSPSTIENDRTEQILEAAGRLFRRYGYHRVSIDQIGEAVNLQGPSVYAHVTSKSEVLSELMLRIAGHLKEALDNALNEDDASDVALDAALRGYIELALLESDLVAVYATELQYLPPETYKLTQRKRLARAKRLADLVGQVRPDLSRAEAKVTLLATLELLFAIARDSSLSTMTGADAELLLLCEVALHA